MVEEGQRRWLRLLPVTLVMAGIFLLSHQRGDSIALPPVVNIDKVLHCLVYCLLGLAALVALSPEWRRQHRCAAAVAVVLFCLAYGLSDEWHQSFVPGRYASLSDLAADGIGGALAVLLAWGWRRRSAARRRGMDRGLAT